MWESLIAITLCYVGAQVAVTLKWPRTAFYCLATAGGITITMFLALVVANLNHTEQWSSLPGDWVLPWPWLSLLVSVGLWTGGCVLVMEWQERRRQARDIATTPVSHTYPETAETPASQQKDSQ